jgi:hypothetical protein
MKPTLSIVLVSLFLALTVFGLSVNSVASTDSDNAFPQLSMPTEHVNYTVTEANGALWAKIDGEYPIQLSQEAAFLPLLYPMPPNTTNIRLSQDDRVLRWSNYTQTSPHELHKTAIGDWWTINTILENVSGSFVLKIHYEHPIERLNGSSIFLYDLNIADYLSEANPASTAYFAIRFESNVTDLHAYTAPPDSTTSQWQSKDFTTTKKGSNTIMAVELRSQYGSALPGDLAVVFSNAAATRNGLQQNTDAPAWVIPVVIDIVLVSVLVYLKRKALSSMFSSRETANFANI